MACEQELRGRDNGGHISGVVREVQKTKAAQVLKVVHRYHRRLINSGLIAQLVRAYGQ
jgi:hypothetical protein